jgi:hypothetical protein
MAGVVILAGHYIDFFNMIMPGTVGDKWFIGFRNCCSFLPFVYLCCFTALKTLLKEILTLKRVNIFIINI